MDAFSILAEAKMRQWEQDVREGKAKRPCEGAPINLDTHESLERKLYHDIRKLIVQSYLADQEQREKMQETAGNLQVQLAARLEKSGYNIMSKLFCDEIQALKSRARSFECDREKLFSLLNELD